MQEGRYCGVHGQTVEKDFKIACHLNFGETTKHPLLRKTLRHLNALGVFQI